MTSQSKELLRPARRDRDRDGPAPQPSKGKGLAGNERGTRKDVAAALREIATRLERNWPLSAALMLGAIVVFSIL